MMPFEIRMQPRGNTEPERRFQSNEQLFHAWERHEATRLRPVTRQHYAYEVQLFLDAWAPTLVTDIKAIDVRQYIRQFGERCQFFRRHSIQATQGPSCAKGQDLTRCGPASCPLYNPLLAQTVEKHLQALTRLYDFLVHEEQLPFNFVRDVKRSWKGENRHRFRQTAPFVPTTEEVTRLINGTQPPNHKVIYAILAKTGIRIGEMLRLQLDPDHMNLDQGWMKIPEFPGKRRGNRILIVDPELRSILRRYLEWRDRKVAKDEAGQPVTNRILVTAAGRPYKDGHETSIVVHMFRPDAIRLGICRAGADRPNRLNPHGLRHYFSNEIKRNEIDPYWWNVLRGDIPKGNEKRYIHPELAQVKAKYLQYAPTLMLR